MLFFVWKFLKFRWLAGCGKNRILQVLISRVVSRAKLFGSAGFGLWFVKIFRADFGPAYTSFSYHWKKRFFSFLKYICSAHYGIFCEWSDCDFSSAILSANTAGFFCSLLGLVSHSFLEGKNGEEISTRYCVEKINHSRDSSLVLRNSGLPSSCSCL